MQVNQEVLRGITTGFNTLFNKVFQNTETTFEKIATRVPSTNREESYKWLGKIPGMREWVGNKQIQNLEASGYTIVNKDFELTVGVDRNDIEDDSIGLYNPVISEMAYSAVTYPGNLVYALLKNGFVNKCYDGKSFFATDHKVGKITYSNKGTMALTADAYSKARASMMSIKGEDGNSLNIIPDLLVVPPALENTARQILKAEYIDGSTNINKDTADVLVAPELAGADTAWYLLCTGRKIKPIIFQERKAPKLISMTDDKDENVFTNKTFLYSVEARGNAGYSLWQLAYGSTGTEA